MFPFADFFQSGLTLGSIYGLSAIALALVWGIVGILNMAHGTFLVLGGYVSYYFIRDLGLPVPVGVLGAVLTSGVVNVVFFQLFIRPIFHRKDFVVETIILTIGLAIVLEAALTSIFTGYPKAQPAKLSGRFNFGEFAFDDQALMVAVTGIALIVVLHLIVTRTSLGRSARAIAQDREAAGLYGIRIESVYRQILFLGGCLGGVSGILLTAQIPMAPYVGGEPMLKAFIVVVVAGIGNITGVFFVGLGLGFIEALIAYTMGPRFGLVGLLSVVIVVLLVRPNGLFGSAVAKRM
ncbi:branched-chain amino acid ABC transporter permease [Brucella grignonensis]|uniref:branched-chain amino acid ABC transporter permease n=1 Tax=Brucella grignonensis TaxID=94627 RepID=UPI0035BC4922